MKKLLLIAAVSATLAPLVAQAESNFVSNSGTQSASARLDFRIVIPKVLFLQVGTGTNLASNSNVDTVTFNVPAASIGNGTVVAGTGGDLTNAVTVRVFGNSGNVSLINNTAGPLSTGVAGGSTVPWSDISVDQAALASPTLGYTPGIAHPAFNAGPAGGPSATATTLAAVSGFVRRETSWTFAYANTAALPAGTYGDTANNGRVTYTATAP